MADSEIPTARKLLWAPWRLEYVSAVPRRGCFLCAAAKQIPDEGNLLVHRGEHALVVMNRFPYNNGHLLLAPRRHIRDLEKLSPAEISELLQLLKIALRALRRELKPQGWNLGMNLERVAGAGLIGHLHLHLVPRWNGDTNFMPVTGNTKVISETLWQTCQRLRPHFSQ